MIINLAGSLMMVWRAIVEKWRSGLRFSLHNSWVIKLETIKQGEEWLQLISKNLRFICEIVYKYTSFELLIFLNLIYRPVLRKIISILACCGLKKTKSDKREQSGNSNISNLHIRYVTNLFTNWTARKILQYNTYGWCVNQNTRFIAFCEFSRNSWRIYRIN